MKKTKDCSWLKQKVNQLAKVKNYANQSKGITLIALIITIIVMLILVAVTVVVVQDGGIFEKATDASKQMEEQIIYEDIISSMDTHNNGDIYVESTFENVAKKYEGKISDIIPELEENGKLPEGTTSVTFKIKGKRGTYTYTITNKLILKEKNSGSEGPSEPEEPTSVDWGYFDNDGYKAIFYQGNSSNLKLTNDVTSLTAEEYKVVNGESLESTGKIEVIPFSDITSYDDFSLEHVITGETSIKSVTLGSWFVEHMDCPSVENLIFDGSCLNLPSYYCSSEDRLQTITFEDGIINIPTNFAFGCSALSTVNLGNTVKSLESAAFYFASNLKYINLENVTSIGNRSFYFCRELETIDLSNCLSLGEESFRGCEKLGIVENCYVEDFGKYCFENCESLTTINLMNAVSIGSGAFGGCPLQNVSISTLLTTCNSGFGNGCNITYSGTLSQFARIFVSEYVEPDSLILDGFAIVEEFGAYRVNCTNGFWLQESIDGYTWKWTYHANN